LLNFFGWQSELISSFRLIERRSEEVSLQKVFI
jgi:hypothetical protein